MNLRKIKTLITLRCEVVSSDARMRVLSNSMGDFILNSNSCGIFLFVVGYYNLFVGISICMFLYFNLFVSIILNVCICITSGNGEYMWGTHFWYVSFPDVFGNRLGVS